MTTNERGRPGGKGALQTDTAAKQVESSDNGTAPLDRLALILGRHARRDCCRRSNVSWPCPRCCHCVDSDGCHHPAFLSEGVPA